MCALRRTQSDTVFHFYARIWPFHGVGTKGHMSQTSNSATYCYGTILPEASQYICAQDAPKSTHIQGLMSADSLNGEV